MLVEVSVKDRIARVSINAPPLNILGSSLQNELCSAFEP